MANMITDTADMAPVYLMMGLHPEEGALLDLAHDDVDSLAARGVLSDWYTDRGQHAEAKAWWLLSERRKRPVRMQSARVAEGRLQQVAWVRCRDGLLFEMPWELRAEVFDRLE